MKKYFFIYFILSSLLTVAQPPGEWTWMSGTSAPNALGVFGIQGIPSASNHPPGLYEVANWKDNQGNFWLYGGIGPGIFVYGDLWKFNPLTLEWTWVYGTGNVGITPSYGVKGVASPSNNPGTRSWGMCSWTDQAGDLWFFGGQTNAGIINDLWRYNTSTNLWTWISGDTIANSPGNFGTLGIPSVNNFPPSRLGETACSWIDDNNNFWLFGGNKDDLWRYNPSTNEWTWMNGSPVAGTAPSWGTKGISAAANTPGARFAYNSWKDNSGNFWLFGGSSTNDMWKYDPAINEWVWMSGTNAYNNLGNYPGICISDTAGVPKSRFEHKCCWTDKCGNFWLLGGNTNGGCINDLWRFNPVTLEWTWVNGSNVGNTASVYGTMGVSSSSNLVGGRMGHSGWVDGNNNLWLYGGSSAGYSEFYSDFWRFVPDTTCTACSMIPSASFTAPNHICPGTCTNFNNLSVNATNYLWTFTGANPGTSTDVNPTNICYNIPGSYTVSLIASSAAGIDTLTLNNYITVYPSPPPQGISQNGDTLIAIPGATSYQWYFNGALISGATNYFYIAPSSGDFNVVATDGNGCEVEAVIFDVVANAEFEVLGLRIEVFPNPVEDKVTIHKAQGTRGTAPPGVLRTVEISVYNVIGEKVMDLGQKSVEKNQEFSIDVRALPSGMYYLELASGPTPFRAKFVKQ